MKSFFSKTKGFPILAVLLIGMMGCTSGGDSGRLLLNLTDRATQDFRAVYVSIQEIAVHAADDPADTWTTIATPQKTVNLLELRNGVREQLALVDLNSGHYTQMRLLLSPTSYPGNNVLEAPHPAAGNYVIDLGPIPNDVTELYHELKIPSGLQTGIKLVQGFDINDNSTTELTLDFDAMRSVVIAGKSGKYLLKPTIHVMDDKLLTKISGTVTKEADATPLGGAGISLQVYDDSLADPKDWVAEWRSTLSDDTTGAYLFFFAVPDAGVDFNIVATKQDYVPAAKQEAVTNGKTYTDDFALAGVGEEFGLAEITIDGANADTGATLSFRQELTPGGPQIEVLTLNLANGSYASDPDVYQAVLPVGTYIVVASTAGKSTLTVSPLDVTKGTHSTLALSFI